MAKRKQVTKADQKKVSLARMAEILGLTPQRVQGLLKEGYLVRDNRKQYDLVKSVQGYVRFLRDKIKDLRGGSDLVAEKIRHRRAQARRTELEVAEREGRLLDGSKVEATWSQTFAFVKQRMRAIPARTCQQLAIYDDPDLISRYLLEEIDEALRGTSTSEVEVSEE